MCYSRHTMATAPAPSVPLFSSIWDLWFKNYPNKWGWNVCNEDTGSRWLATPTRFKCRTSENFWSNDTLKHYMAQELGTNIFSSEGNEVSFLNQSTDSLYIFKPIWVRFQVTAPNSDDRLCSGCFSCQCLLFIVPYLGNAPSLLLIASSGHLLRTRYHLFSIENNLYQKSTKQCLPWTLHRRNTHSSTEWHFSIPQAFGARISKERSVSS